MAHLIDKYALLAEIDRQKIGYNVDGKHSVEYDTTRKILNIIDTLEVKEPTDVFIEKACEWLSKHAKKYYFNKDGHYLGTDELIEDFKLSMELWNNTYQNPL